MTPRSCFAALVLTVSACESGEGPGELRGAPPPPPPPSASAPGGADASSAGPTDAGAPIVGADARADAAADAGDARAPGDCTGLPICDDFEKNDVGVAPAGWGVVIDPPDAGTVAVDATRSVSGTKSVKITFNPNNVGRYSQIRKSLSFLTENAFFGRMRLWVNYAPAGTAHWEFLEGWGYVPGSTSKTIDDMRQYAYGYGAAPQVPNQPPTAAINAYYLSKTCDCFQQSPAVLSESSWNCVEWQFDGVNNQLRFWLDGQAVPDLTVVNPEIGGSWPAPAFEEIQVGWYGVPSVPVQMWIDDVAVGSQRVGCGG